MKNVWKFRLAPVTGIAILAGLTACNVRWREETTASSVSPDGRKRALLVELPRRLDRNFEIRLEDQGQQPPRAVTIFSSPDEGRPVGTERFLWSRDGRYILLVGRHFFAKSNVRLTTGEDLYFLYDVRARQAWCNARQQSALPPFSLETLAGIDFGEPLTLSSPAPSA